MILLFFFYFLYIPTWFRMQPQRNKPSSNLERVQLSVQVLNPVRKERTLLLLEGQTRSVPHKVHSRCPWTRLNQRYQWSSVGLTERRGTIQLLLWEYINFPLHPVIIEDWKKQRNFFWMEENEVWWRLWIFNSLGISKNQMY